MKISVNVKAGSKEDKVAALGNNRFEARVKSAPKEGRANEALIKLLGGHFGVPRGRITITRGLKSKTKVIDIK
jgi:uncharacterized protein